MTIAYGDPFAQLQGELERMLVAAFGTPTASGVYPPVNVFEHEDEYLVKAELPGVAPEQIELNVERDKLTVRGERKLSTPGVEAAYHRHERGEGTFRRVVRLPGALTTADVRAEYRDGVLTVHVPKAKEQKPRRVEIQAG